MGHVRGKKRLCWLTMKLKMLKQEFGAEVQTIAYIFWNPSSSARIIPGFWISAALKEGGAFTFAAINQSRQRLDSKLKP